MLSIILLFKSHIFNLLVKLHVALKTLHKFKKSRYRRNFWKRFWKTNDPRDWYLAEYAGENRKANLKQRKCIKHFFLFKMKKKRKMTESTWETISEMTGFSKNSYKYIPTNEEQTIKPMYNSIIWRNNYVPLAKKLASNKHRYRFLKTRNEKYFQLAYLYGQRGWSIATQRYRSAIITNLLDQLAISNTLLKKHSHALVPFVIGFFKVNNDQEHKCSILKRTRTTFMFKTRVLSDPFNFKPKALVHETSKVLEKVSIIVPRNQEESSKFWKVTWLCSQWIEVKIINQ